MNLASSEILRRSRHLERVESVTAEATVRHVDQLDTETLDAFYSALTADRPVSEADVDLESGEVIVFTDYYRVARA
ncbi:hypothetical protein [Natronorubrum tibetense]|uniref:DUF7979 domain-containing protein n=1 Tax=Natronorubrum tibetense GA33 TaxID=1114856 RepID=L9VVQ3_9EURY|nr:hypothetical protein [Natronorubrum tibetense]ELY41260.1 hypothetical protein C496_09751 [Natronorubrum tibetense GA33]